MTENNPAFEKITKVRLPFDKRHKNPSKNYGIHALDIWFILKGPKGAVQYAVTMPVFLPHVRKELERKPDAYEFLNEIRGFDVGYHAKEPQFDSQRPMGSCDVYPELKDGCFYDGSSLVSDKWTETIFSTTGKNPEDVLWSLLEDEYVARFGEIA